jgi:hypothetical protein
MKNESIPAATLQGGKRALEHTVRDPPLMLGIKSKVGAFTEGVMFNLSNVTVVALWMNTAGSNVMVNDPITGSTGAPAGVKPRAVKLMISVIIAAFAVFVGSALKTSAQAAAKQ